MKNIILFTAISVLLTSCSKDRLNQEEIEFEVRKIVLSQAIFNDLKIELKSKEIKELYRFYEIELVNLKNSLENARKLRDTLNNYKSAWINKIKKSRDQEKLEENEFDVNLDSMDPENQYYLELDVVNSNIDNRIQEIDSIENLYKKTTRENKCYILDFQLKGYSTSMNSNISQTIRVWVDENSNIIKYMFLDIPLRNPNRDPA